MTFHAFDVSSTLVVDNTEFFDAPFPIMFEHRRIVGATSDGPNVLLHTDEDEQFTVEWDETLQFEVHIWYLVPITVKYRDEDKEKFHAVSHEIVGDTLVVHELGQKHLIPMSNVFNVRVG